MLTVGVPNADHPLPVSNCQVPLVLSTAVTAIDSTALPSISVMELSTTMDATMLPVGLISSSVTAVSAGAWLLSNTGASFSAVMLMDAVSVTVLKAAFVPLLVVSAVAPVVPLLSSQARKVIVALAIESPLGTYRMLSVKFSRRAAAAVGEPKAIQPLPVLYCQVPLVLSVAMTAIDSTAPSLSVTDPSTTMKATVLPVGLLLSSVRAVSVGVASARTGASLTIFTIMVKDCPLRILLARSSTEKSKSPVVVFDPS